MTYINPMDDGLEDLLQQYFAIAGIKQTSHRLKYHKGQRRIVAESKRFNVLDLGRRTGKTKVLCDLLVETAEKGFPAGYFAPSYKYLLDGWRDILSMLSHHGSALKKSEQEKRVELPNGGVIECWSLDNEGGGDGKKK